MSSKVRYHRLSQSMESDEEGDDGADEDEDEGFEENILFDSRLVNTPVMDRRDVFELERLGQPRMMGMSGYNRYLPTKNKRICLVIGVLVVVSLITLIAVLFPLLNHAFNHGLVIQVENSSRISEDWTRLYNDSWCESGVRMLDVDGDGLDDVLLGMASQTQIKAAFEEEDVQSQCKRTSSAYPCGGEILALRGYDGAELWRCPARSTVLYIGCADLDVNDDQKTDCIVAGRHSTLLALDVKTGKVYWAIDPEKTPWLKHFISTWTVYYAVSVPDLDGDGTLDLLINHGQDDNVHMKTSHAGSGRLLLISGKSGVPIGDRHLEIHGGLRISAPLVKYVTNTGAVYILFGSGSKTSAGNLMAIALPDLYKAMTGEALVSQDKGVYQWLNSQQLDSSGMAVLASGEAKGILSPPVLVDADGDGTTDILVTSFDGRVTLLDGVTLLVKWTRQFAGSELSGSPAPGYFNSDLFLDFMIHVNVGVWDNYNASKTIILNGADGSTLWSVEGSSYVHSSDLSLRTSADNLSAFLIKLVGRNSSTDVTSPLPGLDIMKRYFSDMSPGLNTLTVNISAEEFQRKCDLIESRTLEDQPSCDQDLSFLTIEVLLLDRLTSARPLKLLEMQAKRQRYLLDHTPGRPHCHALTGRLRSRIGMCVVLTPISYTGAIGDVDADGFLDYIHVTQLAGPKRSDKGHVMSVFSTVEISKLSLNTARAQPLLVTLFPTFEESEVDRKYNSRMGGGRGRGGHGDSWKGANSKALDEEGNIGIAAAAQMEDSVAQRHFENLKLLPASVQPWAQYLGPRGGSWYDVPPS